MTKSGSRSKLTPSQHPGFFITVEGGDGVGKSTQIEKLGTRLNDVGHEVISTREPGGSTGAEDIRSLLVNGAVDRWSPLTEALLMNAARSDHLEKTIRPALERGAVVICDRFSDSTMAYQAIAGQVPRATISALEDIVVADTKPNLTLILTLSSQIGLERTRRRTDNSENTAFGETRFEDKGQEFQNTVAQAFEQIAHENSDRCSLIDARASIGQVADEIWKIVSASLARHPLAQAANTVNNIRKGKAQ